MGMVQLPFSFQELEVQAFCILSRDSPILSRIESLSSFLQYPATKIKWTTNLETLCLPCLRRVCMTTPILDKRTQRRRGFPTGQCPPLVRPGPSGVVRWLAGGGGSSRCAAWKRGFLLSQEGGKGWEGRLRDGNACAGRGGFPCCRWGGGSGGWLCSDSRMGTRRWEIHPPAQVRLRGGAFRDGSAHPGRSGVLCCRRCCCGGHPSGPVPGRG